MAFHIAAAFSVGIAVAALPFYLGFVESRAMPRLFRFDRRFPMMMDEGHRREAAR